jgi:O-antigen ligase
LLLWPRGRPGGRRARLLLISALVALGLVTLARSVVPVLEGTGPADTLGQRPLYWRTAAGIALEHPAFGVGLGGFGAAFAAKEHTLPMKMAASGSHRTHNIFLTLGAETGLVGLTLFVAFLVGPVKALLRRHDPASRLGTALLAAILLHASLHNVLLQDLLWLVIGVVIAIAAGEYGDTIRISGRRTGPR